MGTKTISIRDETYIHLKSAKLEGESFSDVIDRLLKNKKGNLSVYFGVVKDKQLLDGLEKIQGKYGRFRGSGYDCA